MKELIKNHKVWLAASLTLLIMLVAVCISFSGNYHELESYREKEYNATEQQKVISKLTEENTRLKTENTSVQSADSLTEIIQEYIKSYYNSDGTEPENEKALKVRKYVTDELFEQMYDKTEMSFLSRCMTRLKSRKALHRMNKSVRQHLFRILFMRQTGSIRLWRMLLWKFATNIPTARRTRKMSFCGWNFSLIKTTPCGSCPD